MVCSAVLHVEVGAFYAVVDVFFVVFGYVEDEWSDSCVMVMAVLFPDGCAADGDYDSFACFADFDG